MGLALYLLINLLDTIRRDELELWKVHGNEDSDTDKSLLTGDEVWMFSNSSVTVSDSKKNNSQIQKENWVQY